MRTLWALTIASIITLTSGASVHAEGLKLHRSSELYGKTPAPARATASTAAIAQRRQYLLRMIRQSEAQLVLWRVRLRKLDDAEAIKAIEGR